MASRDLFSKPEEIFHVGIKALILNKQEEVLVVETDLGSTSMWDIPGGRINKDHDINITLERELEEELGVTNFENKSLFDISLSKRRIPFDQYDVRLLLITYLCTIPEGQEIIISDEHRQYKWVSREEAAQLLTEKFSDDFLHKVGEDSPIHKIAINELI